MPMTNNNKDSVSEVVTQTPSKHSEVARAPILWLNEAIEYLGIDRRGLARPDMAMQRLIKRGVLQPKKIGGRLAFDMKDLERAATHGDKVRRRGRPRKTP